MSYDAHTIAFETVGAGPPAILVHGNPATHSLWRPLMERLGDCRQLFAIDLPGFGDSPSPSLRQGYAMEELARTVIGFADARGIGQFDLVGHSYGGGIALTIGGMSPERVRTLTAITPLTDHPPPLAVLTRLPGVRGVASVLWRSTPHSARRWIVRNWAHLSYGGGFTPARASEISVEADRSDLFEPLVGLIRGVDSHRLGARVASVSEEVAFPLLLIGATADRVIPHRHFVELAARMPRARVIDLGGCGHVPMWQHPDRVADAIRELWLGM